MCRRSQQSRTFCARHLTQCGEPCRATSGTLERGRTMILPGGAPRNSFCFAPKFNSPSRVDATGAFLPYMEAFARLYGGGHGRAATLPFDNHANAPTEFGAISA